LWVFWQQGGAKLPFQGAASKLISGGKKPVAAAANWVTHIKNAINVTRSRPRATNKELVTSSLCQCGFLKIKK